MSSDARHVGMVGLGNMGGRIARRIRDGGFAISGFDADAEAGGRAGIEAERSLLALLERADVVFLSLPDSTVIEKVVYGDGGLASAARSGQIVVDLSTADPASSVRIHADLAARGAEFLDAGVSGGAAAAEKGTLAVMVGGSSEALSAVQGILATFAANVYAMGAAGAGHTAKLLNNFLNAISLAATAEAMVAGRAAGLDLARLLDVLNHSSGVNFATQNRFPRIIEGDYLEGGLTNELMAKDVRLYLELLRQLGVTSFTGPSCLGAFDMASALGYGKQISNRVVDAIGDAAGGVRLQDYERGGSQ
jgi:3-hydroxyisobutyrate dehydrogenase-like beta-hydroxyacid dehydrogenase